MYFLEKILEDVSTASGETNTSCFDFIVMSAPGLKTNVIDGSRDAPPLSTFFHFHAFFLGKLAKIIG